MCWLDFIVVKRRRRKVFSLLPLFSLLQVAKREHAATLTGTVGSIAE
jgi:hypothetical protein